MGGGVAIYFRDNINTINRNELVPDSLEALCVEARTPKSTRVKTHKLLQVCKQVVASLFTSCQQVVFALLVSSLL